MGMNGAAKVAGKAKLPTLPSYPCPCKLRKFCTTCARQSAA